MMNQSGETNAAALNFAPHQTFDPGSLTITEDAPDDDQAFAQARATHRNPETFWSESERADWMLTVLQWGLEAGWIPALPAVELRMFALQCVKGLQGTSEAETRELLDAVESLAYRQGTQETDDTLRGQRGCCRGSVLPREAGRHVRPVVHGVRHWCDGRDAMRRPRCSLRVLRRLRTRAAREHAGNRKVSG
jgi:hypothetical protein